MPSDAVAVVSTGASRTPPPESPPEGRRLPRRGGPRRSLRLARSYLLLAALVLLSAWLVLVFGRALSELNEANLRAAAVSAETAALDARLEAGQRELELVQGDAFQRMQARAYGMGLAGERAFALDADAPPPPQLEPLGGELPSVSRTPFESWLRLLFGSP